MMGNILSGPQEANGLELKDVGRTQIDSQIEQSSNQRSVSHVSEPKQQCLKAI